MKASDDGSGFFEARLAEGCHRIEVFADLPQAPRRATDVDAEAHELETGRIYARDHADVPDARLDFCLGDTALVDVPFTGAGGAVDVVMTDAHFAMPTRIPGFFGRRARGGFAWALHRWRLPDPVSPEIVARWASKG